MRDQEINKFSKTLLLVNVVILAVASPVFLLLGMYSWCIGYLLGSITSYITFLMHVNNIKKLGFNIKNPKRNARVSYLSRLGMSAIPLAIALFIKWIDIFATFIGLLIIKVTLFIVPFVVGINKNKEGGNEKL